jgi:hypothetical protein
VLASASCLVTDGRTTALLQPVAAPAEQHLTGAAPQRPQMHTEASQQHVQAKLTKLVLTPQQEEENQQPAAGQHLDTAISAPGAGCAAPGVQPPCWATPGMFMYQHLHLQNGHLPPADTTAAHASLHKLLLDPAGSTDGRSSSSSRGGGSSGPPHSSDSRLAADRFGLRHALDYLRALGRNPAYGANSSSSSTATATGDSTKGQQLRLPMWCRPHQVLLLPFLLPPGSISGLQHPWPPQLAAGSCYQGLGAAGCDPTSGARSPELILRGALQYNESALLLPAGPDGSNRLTGLDHLLVSPCSHTQVLLGAMLCFEVNQQLH